ncbi:peroxisome assembly protein (Peroxin-2) [Lecanora helva]
MTSIDFAAAQQRVIQRRQHQATEHRTRLESQQSLHTSNALRRLPPSLQTISHRGLAIWDNIKDREGTRPAFRVGQIDAELLDEELLDLLNAQVGEGLKHFGHIRDDWSTEIALVLRVLLFKLAFWDHNASYGAALQNLQYTDARRKGSIAVPPTQWQKAMYGILTIGGRYGWTKWEEWLVDQEAGYEESSTNVRFLSRFSSTVSNLYSLAAFTSFLVFLVNGRYRTLLDRILRLRLATPSTQVSREVSFEYLNRQLVWHAFTEFLLFLLPLVGISRWRRWLSRAWRRSKALMRNENDEQNEAEPKGELAFLPERTCAICYQDQNPTSTSENEVLAISGASGGIVGSAQTDITNPYEAIPCGCVYCFMCVAKRLEGEDGEGWTCLRCGDITKQCRPWTGDVLQESHVSTNKKTVSFSDEEDRPHSKENQGNN